MVGPLDDVEVVLHDDHRVPPVPQVLEDAQQPLRVPRVEPHARLVQHEERVHERRPEGRGQVHPLELPAGEGPRRPVQGQVLQADLAQVAQPRPHLPQQHPAHRLRRRREPHLLEELPGRRHGHPRHLRQGPPAHPHEQGLGPKPPAAAVAAAVVGAVAGEEDPHVHLVGLRLEPLEPAAHAVPLPALPLDDEGPRLLRQVPPRRVHVDAVLAADLRQVLPLPVRGGGGPGPDGALPQGLRRIGDHEIEVEADDAAEAAAGRAGADGRVEGEEVGRRGAGGEVAGGAVQFPGEPQRRAPLGVEGGAAAAEAVGGLHGIEDAAPLRAAGLQAIHDDLRGRVAGARLGDEAGLGGVPGEEEAGEAEGAEPLEPVLPGEVAAHGEGKGEQRRGARGERVEGAGDGGGLVHGDRLPAAGAVDDAGPGPEELQVVLDLRHRADGGAGRAHGVALLDGDGGGDAVHEVHVGAVHALEELAGVGGEGLDVAALPLGVEGVEDEGGLPRPAHAGDDGEPVAGDVHVDAAEVVLSGAADADGAVVRGEGEVGERRGGGGAAAGHRTILRREWAGAEGRSVPRVNHGGEGGPRRWYPRSRYSTGRRP